MDGLVVAKASPVTIKVMNKKFHVDEDDIEDVIATGSHEAILKFIETKNIYKFDFKRIAWLCKDVKFYSKLVLILKKKGFLDYTVM